MHISRMPAQFREVTIKLQSQDELEGLQAVVAAFQNRPDEVRKFDLPNATKAAQTLADLFRLAPGP